jgi:hypothetical protein
MPARDVHRCQCPACQQPDPHPDREVHAQMNLLLSRLDEQQRRWCAALESRRLGHGGDALVALITGLHVDTIRRGREELAAGLRDRPSDRVRKPGGGRPPVKKKDPELVPALLGLVEDVTGGDPQSGARFVRRGLEALSRELSACGHTACPKTVARLLREEDFDLRVNVKRFTGPPHPDRDRQFRYLQGQLDSFRDRGWPVISVDAKKAELVGNFKNPGALWCWHPEEVNCHDFRTDAVGRAIPYGVYDVLANRGFVRVGLSANTPAFAVAAVRAWWALLGCKRYGTCTRLLILADAGGSNGCRPRLWKAALQEQVADRYGLEVTVCHYPTGASKWNPIEHRLFGPISTNWAGEPLRTVARLLAFVRGTATRTGLAVTAALDEAVYPRGVRVSSAEMQALKVRHHDTCPQWNYTLSPRFDPTWN